MVFAAPLSSMAPHWSSLASHLSFLVLLSLSLVRAEKPVGLNLNLISETETIIPGKPFTVGLHLRHDKGYHTYWKNPGIVGMATSLTWDLPKGFTASEIQWPFPERCLMAGHPCHGYEREVTLLVTITPPQILPQEEITLKASAQWMCCAKSCHPGFQDFNLNLKVGEKTKTLPKNRALIETARQQLPQPKTFNDLALKSDSDAPTIQLTFPAHGQNKAYFFSSDGQISTDQKQILAVNEDGALTITAPRSDYSPEGKKTLPGILLLGNQYYKIAPAYPVR